MQPILKVNLSSREISQISVPPDWERDYLGGASLAARLLYDRLTPDLDPLSPPAPLLFMTGPLTGTAGPAVGRFVICGRSPATGLWGESNCGGFWGPELRMAGYDGLWVEGRAAEPVSLWVRDGEVEIRPASHLWGLDTYETQAAVEGELGAGKVRVASIGPAGEALLPFALILCDHGRVAGRTGMGALMGSKNLKAVAVQGHGLAPVFDSQRYKPLRAQTNRTLREDPVSLVARELGTSAVADYFDYLGEMPKRYYQQAVLGEEIRVSGAAMKETILSGVSACHACVIACGRVVRLEDGQKRKGPEYETLVGFGPNLLLNDLALATRLGELCDRYGMDTISLSNTIGLAFRLFEMGLVTRSDTGGLELDWGNAETVERLVHLTARREGFGERLALGARGLGRLYNAEDEAVQVNGLEVAYHDPRGASGMALVYATSPRGACHNQSDYFLVDIGQVEPSLGMAVIDHHASAEKAANVAIHQDWRTIANSLVFCFFANVEPQTLLDLINTACGLDWSLQELLRCGERGWNLKRVINNRFGLTRANDRLPKSLLEPYEDESPHQDSLTPIEFEQMLAAYYQHRGWDWRTGFPSAGKLRALGLDFALSELYPEEPDTGGAAFQPLDPTAMETQDKNALPSGHTEAREPG
jgi:aldehyde:ferredoxin oxidoreductase